MPVQTIGGVFLASRDPVRLATWFKDALGIEMALQGDGASAVFHTGDGVTVLGIQQAHDDAPAPPAGDTTAEPYGRQPMMANLAIDDLDATIAQLKGRGDTVAGPADYEGMGRFAWVRTPDGHDIELWQPPAQPA